MGIISLGGDSERTLKCVLTYDGFWSCSCNWLWSYATVGKHIRTPFAYRVLIRGMEANAGNSIRCLLINRV